MSDEGVKTLKPMRTETILFLLLAIVLIALETISAILAYETLGAVASTLYWLALALNVPLVALAFRSRTGAAVGMIFLALAIVPYQFALAQRWMSVQTEAVQAVGYVYEFKSSLGEFPPGIGGYAPRNPATKVYLQEYRRDSASGGFVLCYYIGTESTSHCYSPRDGWTYYPD